MVTFQGRTSRYTPETLTDVEVGLKASGHVGSMPIRFSSTAYTGKYKDIQSTVLRTENGVLSVFIVNVGEAKVKGLEIEGSIIPIPGLEIGGYYAITDGKYAEDVALGPQFAGRPLLSVPKRSAGVNATVTVEHSPDFGTLTLSSNLNYQGSRPTSYDGTDLRFSRVDGFYRLDASAEWRGIAGSAVNLRVYAENLLNNRAPISSSNSLSSILIAGVTYLPRRMYGAELSFKF